jgi:hypothetical protein
MSTSPYYPVLDCCPASETEFWFANYVMVEWFGATGDGVTDDSAAFVRALADGRPIGLDARNTYAIINVVIDADMTCPGIFGVGGVPRIVPSEVDPAAQLFTITKPDGFSFDGLFFDMPISTNPIVAPGLIRALTYSPTGTIGTNYRIENCRFSGGRNAVFMTGILVNARFSNNYVTGTWSDGFAAQACDDIMVTDNIFVDGGYATGGDQPSGAIRVGYSDQLESSRNVTIARNHVSRYCVASFQSAIDCFSGSGRNFQVTDNVLDSNGAGIELKTSDWDESVPDVYRNHLIANNLIRLLSDGPSGSTIGITLFYAAEGSVPDKTGRALVTGNMISGVGTPATGDGKFGVSMSGWDDVTISSNHIINVNTGVAFGVIGETDDIIHRLVISANTIEATDAAISSSDATGTVDGLSILNNFLKANSANNAVVLAPGVLEDAEVSGNYIECVGAAALDVQGMQGGRIVNNTVKAATGQGVASVGVIVSRNRMISAAGPAVNVGAGCTGIVIQSNDVEVPIGSLTLTATGTFAAADNNRGLATANPTATAGGALGDTFSNSAAASGDFGKWRCTTAGGAGVAVFKGTEAIA